MKKIGVVLALVFSFVFTFTVKGQDTFELTKYIKDTDGTYGYSDIKVPYYSGSDENIQIPVGFDQVKTDFRSAWVATIGNLNVGRSSSEADFQSKFDTIIDLFKDYNMNSVIFQVRPSLDSYYPSVHNPYSQYIMSGGIQGTDPGFDPLAYMVEATHDAGMDYHAWLNPYRVTNSKYTDLIIKTAGDTRYTVAELEAMSLEEIIKLLNENGILADNNFAVLHPEMTLQFLGKIILDPGIPEVRAHVVSTVAEIITNYDVDGIHFDDYFYPYRVGAVYFTDEDRATFVKYGIGNGYADTQADYEQWRRDNVTTLIEDINNVIEAHNVANKKSVKFGISPFGIWEHYDNNPAGSHTPTGSSMSYSTQIYADTKLWIDKEIIDYVIPQIYWSFDQAAAPYGELARWWNDVVEGTDVELYIGHANYKHATNGGWEAAWANPEEIINQLKFNQTLPNIKGSSMFSYNDLIKSDNPNNEPKLTAKNESMDLIKAYYNENMAIVPPFANRDYLTINAPLNVSFDGTEIKWDNEQGEGVGYYVIYRQDTASFTNLTDMIADPNNVIDRVWYQDLASLNYIIDSSQLSSSTYAITMVNSAHVESLPVLAATPMFITVDQVEIDNLNNLITGMTLPNSVVTISHDDSTYTVTADDKGYFEYTFDAAFKDTIIYVTSFNVDGNQTSTTEQINYTFTAVDIDLENPIVDEETPKVEDVKTPKVEDVKTPEKNELPKTGSSLVSVIVILTLASTILVYSRKRIEE